MNMKMDESGAGHGCLTGSGKVDGSVRQAPRKATAFREIPTRNPAMVMPWPCRVHAERDLRARHPAFPQQAFPDRKRPGSRHLRQSWGITCAQTAIIPINNEIDASAAASSTNNLNMNPTPM
ncbi:MULTISPECIES: hypothetical protein [unclassified Bradyrhizobium]|uniref:hypothetical protein n=1 Tax=unclassified Bradyrhizobium TaxID=2631580 RepID=UPI00143DD141|nr:MULTISPECIES: hypothetical protein [unclassified Bradyrhizobium]